MIGSLQPSLAKILSILNVAKGNLGGLFGPGWVSTPPIINRILLIEENVYNQHIKKRQLHILIGSKGVLWIWYLSREGITRDRHEEEKREWSKFMTRMRMVNTRKTSLVVIMALEKQRDFALKDPIVAL